MNSDRLPYGKCLLPMSFIVMLIVSVFAISSIVNIATAEINDGTQYAYFEIIPKGNIAASNGNSFTIDIYVKNAPVSTDWEATLDWDGDLLNATAVVNQLTGWYLISSGVPENETIIIGASQTTGATISGDVLLCSVTFLVTDVGSCVINLSNTLLITGGVEIETPNNDAFFVESTETVHDVAVIKITLNATAVVPSGTVNITVTIKNEGDYTQNVDVDVYADVVTHDPNDPDVVQVGDEIVIGTFSKSGLAAGTNYTDSVLWTPGNIPGGKCTKYYISAEVTKTDGATDDDPHDNILIDDGVKILVDYDIKIVDMVKFIKVEEGCPVCDIVDTIVEEAYRDDTVYINVTVTNDGQQASSFNVTIDVNGTNVDWLTTNETLPACNTTTLTFQWTPYPSFAASFPDSSYVITATVAPVTGERLVDQADNTKSNTFRLKPKYDRAVTTVAVITPEIWTGRENARMKLYVANRGTETDTFNITISVDHLNCKIKQVNETTGVAYDIPYGSKGIIEVTLGAFTDDVIIIEWVTMGTWVTPPNSSDLIGPYKIIHWTKCDGSETTFAVRSEVYGGSWTPVASAETIWDIDISNNRAEGLPIIVKQIPTDANLDGCCKSDDAIITGKLLGECEPCP